VGSRFVVLHKDGLQPGARSDLENGFCREAVLGTRFRCVLVANDSGTAYLSDASEHLGGNIGTARAVAEIFSE